MSIKRTGGARFDPTERNVYFLASDIESLHRGAITRHDFVLVALNEIYKDEDLNTLEEWVDEHGVRLLLDSGVFNLARVYADTENIPLNEAFGKQPSEIPGFEAHFNRYVEIVKRLEPRLWGYIELDLGGEQGKRSTRQRLEALGLSPIPVYHPFNDSPAYFDELAQNYDRLSVGNLVKASSAARKRLIATLWERSRPYPDLWIHLLGLTPNEWFNAFPFASCDSSGWLAGIRWTDSDRDRTMLKTCGAMGRDFTYVIGDMSAPSGHLKARQLAGYRSGMNLRNWRNHLSALKNLNTDI